MAQAGLINLSLTSHRLAIAGKVIDAETSRSIEGATVAITSGPDAFNKRLAIAEMKAGSAWSSLATRLDRVVTAHDGCFRFANLPDGTYTLTITAPVARYYGTVEQEFVVTLDVDGKIVPQIQAIELPPTGVRGTVNVTDGSSSETLARSLARVRVEGSGEVAYSDEQGAFYVGGVQPGSRRLAFSASGFELFTQDVEISGLGEIVDIGTITLEPSP
jgi:hypothetical protein